MIDILTLALTHGLMAIAAILLMSRDVLDDEDAEGETRGKWRRPAQAAQEHTKGPEYGAKEG